MPEDIRLGYHWSLWADLKDTTHGYHSDEFDIFLFNVFLVDSESL